MREQGETDRVRWRIFARLLRHEMISSYSFVTAGVCALGYFFSPFKILDDIIGAIGLILIVISVLSTAKLFLDRLTDLANKVQLVNEKLIEFNESLYKINETTIEVLMKAVSCVSDLSGAKFIPDSIIENNKEKISELLTSIQINLSSWGTIFKEQSGGDELTEVWLETCATYFREESIDIKRMELVTNARNYLFLLSQTLMVFLRHCSDKEKVLIYAVTPIHPRDWYNWPHGRNKPRAHYEEDYMRFYRGLLQEIIRQYPDRLDVSRVVLSTVQDKLRSAFDWTLPRFDLDYDKLEHWQIVDIPVRPVDVSRYGIHLSGVPEDVFVIPAYYHNFKMLDSEQQSLHNVLSSAIRKIQEWREHAINSLRSDMQTRLRDLEKILRQRNSQKLFDKLSQYFEQLEELDLISFTRFMQIISVHFPVCHGIVDGCIVSVLRYLNSKNVSEPATLKDLWVNQLHTGTNNACYYVLDEGRIAAWSEQKIAPSFVMFGKRNEAYDRDEWKLVILSDIHYPFVTSRIRYITSGDELNKYIQIREQMQKDARIF